MYLPHTVDKWHLQTVLKVAKHEITTTTRRIQRMIFIHNNQFLVNTSIIIVAVDACNTNVGTNVS